MNFLVAFLVVILFSFKAFAEVPLDPLISLCVPYPEIKSAESIKPSSFNTTNNLARSVESGFYKAEGQKIVIYGRIMDSKCVPISAKIYIWQANKEGYVQYKTEKHQKAKWIDPNFDGTGISNSDNMGRFNFITIMPGSANKTTPHINFMVEHPQLETLHSKIYFLREGEIKIHDNLGQKVNQARITAAPGKIDAQGVVTEYFIDITFPEAVPFKEF